MREAGPRSGSGSTAQRSEMKRKLTMSVLAALFSGGALLAPAVANTGETTNTSTSTSSASNTNNNTSTNASQNTNTNSSSSTSSSDSTSTSASESDACALLCDAEILSGGL